MADTSQDQARSWIAQQAARQFDERSACEAWKTLLPNFLKDAESVVEAFRERIEDGEDAFFARVENGTIKIVFKTRSRANGIECGAEMALRCLGGLIQEERLPFSDSKDRTPQRINQGDARSMGAERAGEIVLEFLKWACIGDGKGSRETIFKQW